MYLTDIATSVRQQLFDWDDHEKSGQRQTEMKDEMIRIGPYMGQMGHSGDIGDKTLLQLQMVLRGGRTKLSNCYHLRKL